MKPTEAWKSQTHPHGSPAAGPEGRIDPAEMPATVRASSSGAAAKARYSEGARPDSVKRAGGRTFPGASWFVFGVWAVLMIATLVLIYRHHTCVPYIDDMVFFPVIVGDQPITLEWCWQQQYEHRQFLAMLIGAGLLKLARGDYWMLMLFCALSLAAVAWVLIRVSRRLRGRIRYAHAFLPVALLHWYMGNYLIWGTTLVYQLPTLVAIVMLALILRWGIQLRPGAAVMAGLCLVLLPLCAAPGIVYLPPFMLWLFLCAIYAWRSPGSQPKWAALVIGISILMTLLITGLYFHNYVRSHVGEPNNDLILILKMTVAFLTASFGQSAPSFWPYSGLLLLVLLAASGWLLIIAVWRQTGSERWRAVGLLIFLGATLLMALGVSWGRSGNGFEYIWTYWLLPVPFLLCLFFIWELYAPQAIGYCVQMCLFSFVCVTATLNVRQGLEILATRKTAYDAIERAVQEKMPPYQLVAKYGDVIGLTKDLNTVGVLERLRQAKIGFFADMAPNPPFRVVSLENLEPVDTYKMERDAQTGEYAGDADSYMTLALPDPMFVAAMRVTFEGRSTAPETAGVGTMCVYARASGATDFSATRYGTYFFGLAGSVVAEPTVAASIDQIRIAPYTYPFRGKLVSVDLFVPDTPAEEAK